MISIVTSILLVIRVFTKKWTCFEKFIKISNRCLSIFG